MWTVASISENRSAFTFREKFDSVNKSVTFLRNVAVCRPNKTRHLPEDSNPITAVTISCLITQLLFY